MEIKKLKEFKRRNILLFSGSARHKSNCPGQDSKTMKMIKELDIPNDFDFEIIDLSIRDDNPIIQPCKGCISTAGGAQCNFPCNCYTKNNKEKPDYMHDKDIYNKLKKCDAFIVFAPINWWNVPTQVKSMFDRLVCASLTMTVKQAIEIFGKDGVKDISKTKKFSQTKEYQEIVKNHLEGKIGSFFIHGDDGADDYKNRKFPKSYKKYDIGNFNEPKNAILPIVWQCRYMGIDIPDELITAFYMNEDISYSEANDKLKDGKINFFKKRANNLIYDTCEYVRKNK